LVEINKSRGESLVKLDRETVIDLLESVEEDVKFLARHGFMDYSLLLVVEQKDSHEQGTQ
jgi:hypothetical protein